MSEDFDFGVERMQEDHEDTHRQARQLGFADGTEWARKEVRMCEPQLTGSPETVDPPAPWAVKILAQLIEPPPPYLLGMEWNLDWEYRGTERHVWAYWRGGFLCGAYEVFDNVRSGPSLTRIPSSKFYDLYNITAD